jgi:hypothetical protein
MDGIAGVTRPAGNTALVQYGIQTEDSDMRVHISAVSRRAYVYLTKSGLDAIQSGNFRKVAVYTKYIKTAEGYLVPPDKIPGCYSVNIPDEDWIEINNLESTSEKGRKAVEITKRLLKRKLISVPVSIAEITDEVMQVKGTDIYVSARVQIQVKCDFSAGHKEYGGTGNLFLQISECNPFKRY